MSVPTADMDDDRSGRIRRAAAALVAARAGGLPAAAKEVAALLQDAQDAYLVQAQVLRGLGDGGPWRHWKSGGPSRSATLTHAPLPSRGVWASPADARAWPLRHRVIEAEVALRLRGAVTAKQAAALTVDAAGKLVEAMAVSIEIVDFRTDAANEAPALVKLADLQSHGALVLGDWQPFTPRDWSSQRCIVRIGAAPPREFTGTHSLKDPAWLLPAWLQHATGDGSELPAGAVVTTGTWCGMLMAREGDCVEVEFPGIGRAAVQL